MFVGIILLSLFFTLFLVFFLLFIESRKDSSKEKLGKVEPVFLFSTILFLMFFLKSLYNLFVFF